MQTLLFCLFLSLLLSLLPSLPLSFSLSFSLSPLLSLLLSLSPIPLLLSSWRRHGSLQDKERQPERTGKGGVFRQKHLASSTPFSLSLSLSLSHSLSLSLSLSLCVSLCVASLFHNTSLFVFFTFFFPLIFSSLSFCASYCFRHRHWHSHNLHSLHRNEPQDPYIITNRLLNPVNYSSVSLRCKTHRKHTHAHMQLPSHTHTHLLPQQLCVPPALSYGPGVRCLSLDWVLIEPSAQVDLVYTLL